MAGDAAKREAATQEQPQLRNVASGFLHRFGEIGQRG
jgi:hypothetical protein